MNNAEKQNGAAETLGSDYTSFEMFDNAMWCKEGTPESIEVGDILKCREIKHWPVIRDLSALKYPVVIATTKGFGVGWLSCQFKGKTTLTRPCSAHKDLVIQLDKVKALYVIVSHERGLTRPYQHRPTN